MIIFVLLPKMMIVTRGHNATVNKIIVLLSPRVLLLLEEPIFREGTSNTAVIKKKKLTKNRLY